MGILGNVENGWFAQLAHACRAAASATLNLVSCGNQWGDKLYNGMDAAANVYVAGVNQHAVGQAMANGATEHQALSAGSAALEKIANPQTATDFASLASHGSGVVGETAKVLVTSPPMDILGILTPLLIGAGVVGGVYLFANAFSGPSSSRSG